LLQEIRINNGSLPTMQINYFHFPSNPQGMFLQTGGLGNGITTPCWRMFLDKKCCNGEHKLYVGMGEAGSVTSAMHLKIHLLCLFLLSLKKQSLYRPWWFQEIEVPRFQADQHMNVVRLSAICTGCLYPPGNIPGTHFC